MIAIYILLIIVVFFLVVTNLPVFGKLPTGARLNAIRLLNNYKDGALQNLSVTPMQPEGVSFFKVFTTFLFQKHPDKIPTKTLPHILPDLNTAAKSTDPEIIWFGHSSYLIKIDGIRILVDPIFSKTPSPFSFIGSKNFKGTDFVEAEDFVDIDVLLITHDHYDHLDYQSILKIAPKAKKIITSIGVGAHLDKWGIDSNKINELSWNQSINVFDKFNFTAVPARHFTGRKFKRNQTLWSAFVLKTDNHKLFLGGDSGYDTHFKDIGAQHGPFDIAFLECGQYNELWPYIHMFPEQTVLAAIDLNAKILMPVHWAKFSLAMHPWDEPIKRVTLEALKQKVTIITPKLGETVQLNKDFPTEQWWVN